MAWSALRAQSGLGRVTLGLTALAGLALVFSVGLNAWVCDDAYITLRTVDAWLDGRGLVWNPGERVQAYTHPLWMGLLAIALQLTRDAYLAALLLGAGFTLMATLWLCRIATRPRILVLALLGLALSPSFVHYSTSGLENPASHFLLAVFMGGLLAPMSKRRSLGLYAVVALLLLNRADMLFLVVLPCLTVFYEDGRARGWARAVGAAALGASPLILWELFTLVYYGSLVPNTAYAKLAHGLPRSEVATQGVDFLHNFVTFDPVGAVVLLVSLAALFVPGRGLRHKAIGAGILLALGYVVWIGGDFMSGRMLTPMLMFAVCGFATLPRLPSTAVRASSAPAVRPEVVRALAATGFTAALAGLLWLGGYSGEHVLMPLAESFDMDVSPGSLERHATHWLGSERHRYAAATGLWEVRRGEGFRPQHPWYARGEVLRGRGGVHRVRNIGFAGYTARDGATLVDPYALSSAFLARLPAFRNLSWHVGHYQRVLPPGYLRSVTDGTCHMDDEELCELFDNVQRVTRAPLFSEGRLDAIVALYGYRPSAALAHRMRFGEVVRARASPSGPIRFVDSGVRFPVPPVERHALTAQLTPCLLWRADFYADGDRVASRDATTCDFPLSAAQPFDEVHLYPLERGPRDSNQYRFMGVGGEGAQRD
ncbi:MAG: hypothetical protein AB8I08_18515 [Sandaracinaceae bacterium]